ncbi:MAG: DUF4965 domain-containing protein [Ruminococcaceae bacterium]|nr:DUF4965 domain-containing protein [Oscillospiraceae bacterium]
MKLRAPAYPLITVDPNFSVWSDKDILTDGDTVHWTASPMIISGVVTIDGAPFRVIGKAPAEDIPPMKQTSVNCSAFSTEYKFRNETVELTLKFTSPIDPEDLYLVSRPVSYLKAAYKALDGKDHKVSIKISVSEQICMDKAGDDEVVCEKIPADGVINIRMSRKNQQMLKRDGDDLRAEWGYFYLSAKEAGTEVCSEKLGEMTYVSLSTVLSPDALITFSYDDIYSLEYFHTPIKAYWKSFGRSIEEEIKLALADYDDVVALCEILADKLFVDAVRAGGEKYAELLELAMRQTIAAHKLCLDDEGELIYVSKECFSNGCAATVDVSYPSIPLFLIYNPELIKAMMRPVYKYARSEAWKYDFAPHDAGRYPLINGQMYHADKYEKQMPVEECGNMLVMEATTAIATGDVSFAISNIDLLSGWVKYLIDNGRDPANQLCTDDFAGHLAHNCNLSLKAIMGIACYGIILGMNGDEDSKKKYIDLAKDMALDWEKRARNDDGSYRLAFDAPDTFSMKYNIVWDKLFGTEIMPKYVLENEVASYRKRAHAYGLPLDNRMPYTKSDWLVWTATLAERREDFEALVAPMWNAFNVTPSRVPMTDWYYTITSEHKSYHGSRDGIIKSFRNRTVQGGLFMKVLEYKKILKLDN